jgi:hypothetical protein
MRYLHIFTVLGAILGGFELINVILTSPISAPQEGAGAAMAVACVVIPYCFARAMLAMENAEDAQLKRLNDNIETHTRLLAAIANAAARKTPSDTSGG